MACLTSEFDWADFFWAETIETSVGTFLSLECFEISSAAPTTTINPTFITQIKMADIAGLAIGIVALVDTCVTICGLISRAKHLPEDLEFLRIGILWEESRLKDWAKKWELGEIVSNGRPANLQSATLLIEEAKLMSIELDLILETLNSTEALLKRCQEMVTRHQPRDTSRSVMLMRVIKPLSSAKSKVQWSVIDSATFHKLVADLEKQNDRLHRLQPRVNSTSREVQRITTTSRTIASLNQLGIEPDYQALNCYPEIKQLLSMRKEQNRTEAAGRNWVRSGNLHIEQAEYKVQYDSRFSTTARAVGTFTKSKDPVLIEWKYYVGSDSDSKDMALSRTERIAELLAATGKPSGFRILDCVGWFVDETKHRCGIMFSIPQNPQRKEGNEKGSLRCFSLSDLIRARTRPTLRERFRLAYLLTTSLLELHLANWLHKNFNSDNVVLFVDDISKESDIVQKVDFTAPYVASFGLSRPDHHLEVSSIAMSATPVNKAYQHPEYSAKTVCNSSSAVQIPRYTKLYDIYSLGCVLLEISLWTTLGDLGWDAKDYSNDLGGWQRRLRELVTTNVAFHAGPVYRDIVLSCLDAETPRNVNGSAKEADVDTSAEALGWDIICKLDQLSV